MVFRLLPVLTLAVAVAAAAQTPVEDAEVEYSHGLFALNAGDLDRAADRFRAAVDLHPEEGRYWLELARAESLRGDPAGAAEALESARERGVEIEDLPFHLGVALLTAGRSEEARARLEEARKRDPGRAMVHLYLGLSEEGLGNPAAAVEHFEEAARLDPSLRDDADLLSARVYLGQEMGGEARELLESAAGSENEEIVRLSRGYLEQYDELLRQEPSPWSVAWFLAAEYDDNVTLNPEDPAIEDFPADGGADLRAVGYGQLAYRPRAGRHGRFGIGYSAYTSHHESLSDFDIEGHMPELSYSFRSSPFRFDLVYNPEYFYVGHDDYLRRHQAELRFGPGPGVNGTTDLYFRYRDDTYFDNPDRDAVEWSYGVEQRLHPWDDRSRYLSLHAEVADRDSGRDYARREREAGIAFFTPLVAGWDLFSWLTYTELDYDNVDSVFRKERDDEEWDFVVRAAWGFAEDYSVIFQFRLMDHRSNVGFYDYDARSVMVGLLAQY